MGLDRAKEQATAGQPLNYTVLEDCTILLD
jgi:hypothetical protein